MANRKIRPIRVEGNIAYVPLTRGYEAIIDAADVPLVEGLNWLANADGRTVYAQRSVRADGRMSTIRFHRFLLNAPADMQVDHINGNGLDNRRGNLRLVTQAQNIMNQRASRDNTSGFKGVCWHKGVGKWNAYIKAGGVRKSLGYFDTREGGHAAYRRAALELHGEFANFG